MWYWLRDLLVPQGIDLPLGPREISQGDQLREGEDRRDRCRDPGAAVARAAHSGGAHMISDTHREMRDLLRARLLLVSRSIRCQRSVGALMLEKYSVSHARGAPRAPAATGRPPHGATGVAQDPGAPAGERATGARACDPRGAATRVGARHRANGGVHPAARDR